MKLFLNLVLYFFKGKKFKYRLLKVAYQRLEGIIINLIYRPLLV